MAASRCPSRNPIRRSPERTFTTDLADCGSQRSSSSRNGLALAWPLAAAIAEKAASTSGSVGGVPPGDFEQALLWVLSYSDGAHDLLSIAERSRLGFARIAQAAAALEQAGLARDIDEVGAGSLQ